MAVLGSLAGSILCFLKVSASLTLLFAAYVPLQCGLFTRLNMEEVLIPHNLFGMFLSQGCTFVVQAFVEYFRTSWDGMASGNVILMLVEAVGNPISPFLISVCIYGPNHCI
jgi:hypothetical protein